LEIQFAFGVNIFADCSIRRWTIDNAVDPRGKEKQSKDTDKNDRPTLVRGVFRINLNLIVIEIRVNIMT
jgi:hypothetical protein